jgi:hypothetical protein
VATSNHGTFDVTKVDTTAYTPLLGTEIVVTDTTHGDRTWIYIKNTSVAGMVEGDVVLQAVGAVAGNAIISPSAAVNAALVVGVAQSAIAASAGGWIMRKGRCEVNVFHGTTLAANSPLKVYDSATGDAMLAAATDPAIGYLVDAHSAVSGTEKLTAYIDCRG